jgi:hypothetical protein
MAIRKNGILILTLEDWEKHAGPKSKIHWKDGRSAKESARAWLEVSNPVLPAEIARTLATNPAFGLVQKWDAEPEAKLCFDAFSGEPRNSDVLVHATDTYGVFLIGAEAKADESFGESVADALAAAVERHVDNPNSNGVARIHQLAAAMLGSREKGEPPLKHIRYQLLTACAGVLCEAERQRSDRAILLIHEFVTDKTKDAKHSSNQRDLNRFVARLSHGKVTDMDVDNLYGPFEVPGNPLLSSPVKLFIGKARRVLRKQDGTSNTHMA